MCGLKGHSPVFTAHSQAFLVTSVGRSHRAQSSHTLQTHFTPTSNTHTHHTLPKAPAASSPLAETLGTVNTSGLNLPFIRDDGILMAAAKSNVLNEAKSKAHLGHLHSAEILQQERRTEKALSVITCCS